MLLYCIYIYNYNILYEFIIVWHQNSYETMLQMEKLIDYVNSNKTYNATMIWSTLGDYVTAVNKLNLTWNVERAPLFNYVDSPHKWWTGYFTSRPSLKLYARSRELIQRTAEQFYFYAKQMNFSNFDFSNAIRNITKLRDSVGVVQHHDAITGTEKDPVSQDYKKWLSDSTVDVQYFVNDGINKLLSKNGNLPGLSVGVEQLTKLQDGQLFVVVLYNSLAWKVSQIVRIPTNRSDLVAYDSNGKLLMTQINPSAPNEDYTNDGFAPFEYPSQNQLYIKMDDIAPLSLSTIFIGINATAAVNGKEVSSQPMGKGYYTVTFDDDTGLLSTIKNNYLNKEHSVENQFIYYAPSGGKYYDGLSPSGAYIFRPAQSNRYILGTNNNNKYKDIITTGLRFPATGFISNPSNGNPYDDAYNARICNINTAKDEFSFMYMRTDKNGWGDTPGFDWIEFDTNTIYERGIYYLYFISILDTEYSLYRST